MQLDWFTLVAQIVNFLILVFLLQLFLYRPIVKAMDAREEKIAARLAEAEQKRQEADEQFDTYRQKLQEYERQREKRLHELGEEIEERRSEMLTEIREEMEALEKEWREDLAREHKSFLESIRITLGQEFGRALGQLMAELADASLEQQMIQVFSERLNEISEKQRMEMQESLERAEGSVTIRSGFDMTEEARRLLSQHVHNNLFPDQKFEARYEISDDLIAGVELQVDGRKLTWTVQEFLDTLQTRIQEALQVEFEENNTKNG